MIIIQINTTYLLKHTFRKCSVGGFIYLFKYLTSHLVKIFICLTTHYKFKQSRAWCGPNNKGFYSCLSHGKW